jgi:hypothetical protein
MTRNVPKFANHAVGGAAGQYSVGPERRGGQRQRLAGLKAWRPEKDAVLKPFCEQAEAGAVPTDDLDQVGPGAAPKREQVAGERILMQHALHQHREAIDTFAHVDVGQGQMHLYVWREQGRHDADLSTLRATSVISTATNAGHSSCFHRHKIRRSMP